MDVSRFVSQPLLASPSQLAKPAVHSMSVQSFAVQSQPNTSHLQVLQSSPTSRISPMNSQGSHMRSVHSHVPPMSQMQLLQPLSGERISPGSQHWSAVHDQIGPSPKSPHTQ